uniref:Glycoside hydrolase family 28 n=1 Tax=Ramulus artemis TaxID=1390046 RepID=A0A191XT37_9NEOP|nr:glycoside hydrolase family 28 [Ramulus artemis]
MQRNLQKSLAFFAILAVINVGNAQDLRNVEEPKTPESCTSLKATGGDDTEVIQKALDSCTEGKAVALSSGVFYSGPLTIPSGVSLLVDSGVTLKAIPDPKLYDLGANTCGTLNEYGVGCRAFITMQEAKGSGIYGKGTIDGQANVTMTGKNQTWWDLSLAAQKAHNYQNNPMLVKINKSMDITLYQITLINSPFYTAAAYETNGWTVWGLTILASVRNTDGIDPVGCQNVTITRCYISNGDDAVAIKALTAPSRYISVVNIHIGSGNGFAIGSETNCGVRDVVVANITTIGTLTGINIKSNYFRGGTVENIVFDNFCAIKARRPVFLDMKMNNLQGPNMPVFRNITINNMYSLTKGIIALHGISSSNSIEATLHNVHIAKGSTYSEYHTKITGEFEEDATGTRCGTFGNE